MPEQPKEVLFENIDGSEVVQELESMCMQCNLNGITKLLPTKIPHFREVIVMAFECPHCGYHNNEIKEAGAIQPKGVHQQLNVVSQKDLSRQIIKGESATVRFEEIDFEIPPNSQKGVLTTIDGMILRAIEGLNQQQPLRKIQHPELYEQIEKTISVLQFYYDNQKPFTFTLDDPSGNSYIQNLCAPNDDPQIITKKYKRSLAQSQEIGLTELTDVGPEDNEEFDLNETIHHFPSNCSRCNTPCETRMHMVDIPHFKSVIIMSTSCDSCGYKSNEVKSGGAISAKGEKITLKMTCIEDLSRDILKSESCSLRIPEIQLELDTGTLGGRFTTVEGLLSQVHEELLGKASFLTGDSGDQKEKEKFQQFLDKLDAIIKGDGFPCHLILNDPLANSHLQNIYAPDKDPEMEIEEFDRTYDDNEEWGLNDIKVDDY